MEASKSIEKITVKVGKRPEDGSDDETKYKEYNVPGKILASVSLFFQTRLKPAWIARSGSAISLPDHLPAAFDVYLRWINTQEVLVGSNESGPNGLETLIPASILGEPLLDKEFRDVMSDAIINFLLLQDNFAMVGYLQYIYENTNEDDPLREIGVDSCVYQTSSNWTFRGRRQGRVLMEIMWDLIDACQLRAYASYVTFKDRVNSEPYRYHKHNDEECYKRKRKYRDGVIVLPQVEDKKIGQMTRIS